MSCTNLFCIHIKCIYQYCLVFLPGMECKLYLIHNTNSSTHTNQMKKTLVGWFVYFFLKTGHGVGGATLWGPRPGWSLCSLCHHQGMLLERPVQWVFSSFYYSSTLHLRQFAEEPDTQSTVIE